MAYRPVVIANYFIELAEEAGTPLTPMQVQKLVFFAHGWHLAIQGTPLIDEQVEAWKFGPVIRSLYSTFRDYGSKPIDSKYRPLKIESVDGAIRFKYGDPPSIEDQAEHAEFTRNLLKKVWDVYGKYTAYQLSNMTHAPGTPWHTAVQKYGVASIPKGTDIPSDVIREYFAALGKHKNAAC